MPAGEHPHRSRLRRPARRPRRPDPRHELRSRVERAGQARPRFHGLHGSRPRPAHRSADPRGAPGFQFLHCIENTVAGGWSRMSDGWGGRRGDPAGAPRGLRRADHARLDVLQPGEGRRAPLGRPDHRPRLAPPAAHPAGVLPGAQRAPHGARRHPRAYESLRVFATMARDPRFQLVYPFRPGEPGRVRQPPHPPRARRVRVGRLAAPARHVRRPRRLLLESCASCAAATTPEAPIPERTHRKAPTHATPLAIRLHHLRS